MQVEQNNCFGRKMKRLSDGIHGGGESREL